MITGYPPKLSPSAPALAATTRPRIRQVAVTRPFHWLQQGLDDLHRTPSASLAGGALFALVGIAALRLGEAHPDLTMAALSGFLLVGPLLAAGFYELSRRGATDAPTDTFHALAALRGLKRCWRPLAAYGMLLALFYFCWERLSVALLALFLGQADLWNFSGLLREIFLTPHHPILALAWLFSGGLLAALCFLVSVVTAPMIVDRSASLAEAVETSVVAVSENVGPMLLWSGLIVALVLTGFATFMVGLVLTLPLLGHATWHAYRELVE